jgi:hypothetical protein
VANRFFDDDRCAAVGFSVRVGGMVGFVGRYFEVVFIYEMSFADEEYVDIVGF